MVEIDSQSLYDRTMPTFAKNCHQRYLTATNLVFPIMVLGLFLLGAGIPIFPQTTEIPDEFRVFAPFVSNLRVAVRDPQVRLTWEDIPETSTRYAIYRYTEEITGANFSQAVQAGIVPRGTQMFIDTPPTNGRFFYAVLALNDADVAFEIFIPLRNITLIPAEVNSAGILEPTSPTPSVQETQQETPQESSQTLVQEPEESLEDGVRSLESEQLPEPEPEPDPAARITNLRAVPDESGRFITITFGTDSPNRRVSIYRATSPILNSEALSSAILVDTLGGGISRVNDYVVPGITYFYAVIDTDFLDLATSLLVPSESVTISGVNLPLGIIATPRISVPEPRSRTLGLPLLNPQASFLTGTQPPELIMPLPQQRNPLTAQNRQAFQQITRTFPQGPPTSPRPRILPEDLAQEGDIAEARILQTILRTEFMQGNWSNSLQLLDNLLTLSLEPDRRSRVEFYIAQSNYFLGNLERAFFGFLLTQDDLGQEAQLWMDHILARLSSN